MNIFLKHLYDFALKFFLVIDTELLRRPNQRVIQPVLQHSLFQLFEILWTLDTLILYDCHFVPIRQRHLDDGLVLGVVRHHVLILLEFVELFH